MGAAIPLREIATPSTPEGRRAVIIANAQSMLYLSAWPGDPAARAEFEDILGPVGPGQYWDLDRPFHVNADGPTYGVSTCGLVVRGNMRRSGVDDPTLYEPYEPGSAFSSASGRGFIDFARRYGAWKVDGNYSPGCYIVIGSGLMTHTFTCIELTDTQIIGADGGSIDKDHGSLQYINRSVRDISSLQYVGHVDPDTLPFRPTCLVPPQYGGVGLSTGNVVTALVFAGLGYMLGRKYGSAALERIR